MDVSEVSRFEVIDHRGLAGKVFVGSKPGGRMLLAYDVEVELSLQDEGQTLKVFLR